MDKFVVVDIETTGNSLKKGDRIIQFAAVVIENGAIVDTYTTFINPEIEISPFITELTGIDQETVRDAPVFLDVADQIVKLFDHNAYFVAHNVHFDLTFLQDELELAGYNKLNCRIIDTVEMTRILMPTLESYKLSDIAIYAGFEHDRPHQADSDAFVTAEWFLSLLEKANQLPIQTTKQLMSLARDLKTDLHIIFSNIYANKEKHKNQLPEDLNEFRGIVLKKPDYTGDFPQDSIPYPNISSDKQRLLQKGFSDAYEERTNQEDMIQLVYDSLKNGEIALIEAEPGFGKTISYLLPAAIFSINENKPVIISTHTVVQQHQIIEKEVPRLIEMLNQEINVQIVKGKSHYLDMWKFERLLKQENEHYDETITKMQILVWLIETVTGDADEINLSSGGIQFWQRISALNYDDKEQNPWEQLDFYKRALRRAQSANLIVTNHHFLLADLTGEQILPDYDYVIIDEAHQFEKNASKFYGSKLTFRKIKFLMGQLGSADQMKLIGKLISVLANRQLLKANDEKLLQQYMDDFAAASEEFFQLCVQLNKKRQKNAYGKISINFDLYSHNHLVYSWERFYDAFQKLYREIEERYIKLENSYGYLSGNEKIFLDDLSLFLLEFYKIEHFQRDLLMNQQNDHVFWLEMDERAPLASASIYGQPLYIGDYLGETLYSTKKALIFCSSTLTVKGDFSFIKDELGLSAFPVMEKQFKAPFSYKNQVSLYSVEDLPNVSDVNDQEFIEAISSTIISIAEASQERILILFTSHDMLKKTYYLIKDSELLADYVMLAQGISNGSIQRLVKQFVRFEKAVLFGSYSLWEGIDMDKEAISSVIMVRLPFSSPQEPIHYGKVQAMNESGKNAFYDYSLPEAVIRFKQGFGRLIRSKKDKGNFIILDKRIYTSKYGAYFLKSIPNVPLEIITVRELCEKLEHN